MSSLSVVSNGPYSSGVRPMHFEKKGASNFNEKNSQNGQKLRCIILTTSVQMIDGGDCSIKEVADLYPLLGGMELLF